MSREERENVVIVVAAVVVAAILVLGAIFLRWLIVAVGLTAIYLLLVALFPDLPTWLASSGVFPHGATFGNALAIAVLLDLLRMVFGRLTPSTASKETSK